MRAAGPAAKSGVRAFSAPPRSGGAARGRAGCAHPRSRVAPARAPPARAAAASPPCPACAYARRPSLAAPRRRRGARATDRRRSRARRLRSSGALLRGSSPRARPAARSPHAPLRCAAPCSDCERRASCTPSPRGTAAVSRFCGSAAKEASRRAGLPAIARRRRRGRTRAVLRAVRVAAPARRPAAQTAARRRGSEKGAARPARRRATRGAGAGGERPWLAVAGSARPCSSTGHSLPQLPRRAAAVLGGGAACVEEDLAPAVTREPCDALSMFVREPNHRRRGGGAAAAGAAAAAAAHWKAGARRALGRAMGPGAASTKNKYLHNKGSWLPSPSRRISQAAVGFPDTTAARARAACERVATNARFDARARAACPALRAKRVFGFWPSTVAAVRNGRWFWRDMCILL